MVKEKIKFILSDIGVASRRVDMCSCRRRLCYPQGSFSVVNSPHQKGVLVR